MINARASNRLLEPARPGTRSSRLLLLLSKHERAQFFPGRSLEESLGPLPLTVHEVPAAIPPGEFRALLATFRPEIILGAWSMPPLSRELLDLCPSLRYLCYLTGSVRRKVDRSFLERGGIVTNWGDAISPSVAECALMLTLMCLRQANRHALEMHVDRTWTWTHPDSRSLFGKRIGLHGFGAVARALLSLLRPFGAVVEAYSEPVPPEVFAAHGVRQAASLASLYRGNTAVIVVEALTPNTRNSVGMEVLREMQPGSAFVNVARGAIVDDAALLWLASRGEVQIGLDVYSEEPLPADSPLRGMRNVVLLPHTAGPTPDWYPECARRAIGNLTDFLQKRKPKDSLPLERYDDHSI